jgi:uncharacterized protein (UPF0261 family)
MAIKVRIEGARDSSADYDDEQFLAADATARQAIADLFDCGASVANIAEAVQGGLEDADSGAAA